MSSATLNSSWQFHADRESGTKKAFALSLGAHLFLIALLTLGISWKTSTSSGVEVELWDSNVPTQAVIQAPKVDIKPEAADIAVKKTKVAEPTKEAPKKIELKPETKPEKKVEVKPPEKKVDPKEDAAAKKAAAAAEKARADQLARLKAAAGAEGGSGGKVGDGVGSGNAPPGYADRVRKKIKPLIVFNAESTPGNPAVVVLVDLAPDGMILKRTVTSPSGDPAWDRAVLLAIDRAESLPRDENGKIPMRQIKLTFKPKD